MQLNCTMANVTCWKFVFTNNTIKNHFMMKTVNSTFFPHRVNWQMEKFGMIIQIHNFKGDIEIKGNTILDTRQNFNDFCLYYENLRTKDGFYFEMSPSVNWISLKDRKVLRLNQKTKYLIPMQNSVYQLSSLITIDNISEKKNVDISHNTFKGNIVSNALVSITQKETATGSGQVQINNNSFSDSSSYMGTNAILVTKVVKSNYILIDSENWCGRGVQIKGNQFTRIVGTCQTDTGILRVQCNNTEFANSKEMRTSDYRFINQTRQIPISHGSKGILYNSTSLQNVTNISDATFVDISDNQITNCSAGVA